MSGKEYKEYLTKNGPLKMTSIFVNRPRFAPKDIPNLTKGHVNGTDGNPTPIDTYGTDQMAYFLYGIVGYGIVNSTITDLILWYRALYTTQLLPKRQIEKMFTPHTLKDGKLTSYGFSWQLKDPPTYGRTIRHFGTWAGYLTYIERYVVSDKTLIFLQNTSLMTTGNPVFFSRKLLYNEPMEIITFTIKEYSMEELKTYTGI
jgi:CubicO group peptidase (beta-lactamase class C family)